MPGTRKRYCVVGGFRPSDPMPRFYRFLSQQERSDVMTVRRVGRNGLDLAEPDETLYEGDPLLWTDEAMDLGCVADMAEAYESSCEQLGFAYINTLETLAAQTGRASDAFDGDRP